MSLGLATKGILSDFTGTGGSGATVYVLEEFNVQVTQNDLEIEISVIDDLSIDISEVGINIDFDQDDAEIIVSEDDTINIEV